MNYNQPGMQRPMPGVSYPYPGPQRPGQRPPQPNPGPQCQAGEPPRPNFGPPRYPIGMGYVPVQEWETPYPKEQGFRRGTIFPSLDYPFLMGRCKR